MFGCLVAGRLVQTDMTQVDQTHFIFTIDHAESVNHIVIFLTGAIPFPDGMCGAIHFSWPSNEGVAWQYLGFINNNKPSAIFKVSGLRKEVGNNNLFMQSTLQGPQTVSQIGIAIEPVMVVAQQTPAQGSQTSKSSTFVEFTTKMVENFFNYASSFGIKQSQMTAQPEVTWVPISVVGNWFENFKRKMTQDPNFWKL